METIEDTREILDMQKKQLPDERVKPGVLRIGRILAACDRGKEAVANGNKRAATSEFSRIEMQIRNVLIALDNPHGSVEIERS